MREKEIQEAIYAGERALDSLRDAQDYLNSAKNWGIVDIFGGGLLTDLIKHSKLNKAAQCMDDARCDLRAFQKELRDVEGVLLNVNIGDFLTFADFFFDGFVADILVQSKISDARNQVAEAINRVETIIGQLRYQL